DRVEALELLAEPLDLRLESLDLALGVSLAAVMLLERGVRLGPDLLHPGLGLSVRLRLRLELLHPLARGTEGLLGNPLGLERLLLLLLEDGELLVRRLDLLAQALARRL